MKNGDRNTKFFHGFASERRRRNRIKRIVKEDGSDVEAKEETRNLVSNFYKNIFRCTAGTRYDELLAQVHPRVSQEMNLFLMREFTDKEIKLALDDMGDLKAPGANGMLALFYKQFWDIVGANVAKEVKDFLGGGDMPEGWNDTVVVLIPKVPNPERLKDLQPISLCNVIYKIVSKVLSNRLKVLLTRSFPGIKVPLFPDG